MDKALYIYFFFEISIFFCFNFFCLDIKEKVKKFRANRVRQIFDYSRESTENAGGAKHCVLNFL